MSVVQSKSVFCIIFSLYFDGDGLKIVIRQQREKKRTHKHRIEDFAFAANILKTWFFERFGRIPFENFFGGIKRTKAPPWSRAFAIENSLFST